jgi:hypothetical protein
VLQAPIVEGDVDITGGAILAAGTPINGVITITQNGVSVDIYASDGTSSGTVVGTINASNDGYGAGSGPSGNNLVDPGESVIYKVSGTGNFVGDSTITVGNFSTNAGGDTMAYELWNDGSLVKSGNITPTASNSSPETTFTLASDNLTYDEIRLSGDDYKIINLGAKVSTVSELDMVLDFGVDVTDTDGDVHGGDFQVAFDTNGDSVYPVLDSTSLDDLIGGNNGGDGGLV